MKAIEITKSHILPILKQIYNETNKYSAICPANCDKCEDREDLLLLPSEEEFIIQNQPSSKFCIKDEDGFCYIKDDSPCPKFNSNSKCDIYQFRPLDCRSFPVVPRFSLVNSTSIDFFFANSYCPLIKNKELSKEFIKTTIYCWKSIVIYLPLKWKELYNNLNGHSYVIKAKISDN